MKAHATRTTTSAAPATAARAPRAYPAVRAILRGPAIQPKLKIGAVNDPAEREADRVADEVMRMAEPQTVRRMCEGCAEEAEESSSTIRRQHAPDTKPDEKTVPAKTDDEKKDELNNAIELLNKILEEKSPEKQWELMRQLKPLPPIENKLLRIDDVEDPPLKLKLLERRIEELKQERNLPDSPPVSSTPVAVRAKSISDGGTAAEPAAPAEPELAPPLVHEILRSPGQPLDHETRAFMEPRFGDDFEQVRVHTGAEATASARAINALAYTVGRDVVFADHQYAPGTSAGRRLLAHELTHVAQQGQSSAGTVPHPDVLRRTPAAPTYGGVTGVPDLKRIRIATVPDLLASDLITPRIVNVYVTDPAVTHISWELYDPSDKMITGYATLPGSLDAKTRVFALDQGSISGSGSPQPPSLIPGLPSWSSLGRPSWSSLVSSAVSATKLAAGKYILRCSGLNASHQPIVYADRDFNVVKSDLTTGTARATTYGELTFTQYKATDANPPAAPNWSVDVKLSFLPKRTVPCTDVTYIQALESVDNQGNSLHHFSSAEQDARQTPLAWSVDRVAGAPSSFYIRGRDATGKIIDVAGWGRAGSGGQAPAAATLIDRPNWGSEAVDHFETCVICRSGASIGEVYGCATWGYTATAIGKVTLMPRGFHQMPSNQFKEARAAWNIWRTTLPAATQPKEAPALTSPK